MDINDYDEADELGRNVTHLAKPDGQPGKVIVSVSLDYSEIVRLERIGQDTGQTITQVISDAIAAYQVEKPTAPAQR